MVRDYGPYETYIEQGPSDVLKVQSSQVEPAVIYAIFLQLPEEGQLTNFEDDPGC